MIKYIKSTFQALGNFWRTFKYQSRFIFESFPFIFRKNSVRYLTEFWLGSDIPPDTLRKKCPYSEFFWPAFSQIWTEYGEILRISPYSVRMRENADQNNSEYGHFSRSDSLCDHKINCYYYYYYCKPYENMYVCFA